MLAARTGLDKRGDQGVARLRAGPQAAPRTARYSGISCQAPFFKVISTRPRLSKPAWSCGVMS